MSYALQLAAAKIKAPQRSDNGVFYWSCKNKRKLVRVVEFFEKDHGLSDAYDITAELLSLSRQTVLSKYSAYKAKGYGKLGDALWLWLCLSFQEETGTASRDTMATNFPPATKAALQS